MAQVMRPPTGVALALALALALAHEAALTRPVLQTSTAPDGISVPALQDMYLDPDFRVRAVAGTGAPSSEAWWEEMPVRRDLTDRSRGLRLDGLWFYSTGAGP